MSNKPLDGLDQQILNLLSEDATRGRAALARELDKPPGLIRSRLLRLEKRGLLAKREKGDVRKARTVISTNIAMDTADPDAVENIPPQEKLHVKEDAETGTIEIESVGQKIKNYQEACEAADITPEGMEVAAVERSIYEVTVKDDKTGGFTTVPMVRVYVKLKKKVEGIEDMVIRLCEIMDQYSPDYTPFEYGPVDDPHLLVLGIMDLHFGKKSWAEETGEDTDHSIMEERFRSSIDSILAMDSLWQ